MRILGLIPARGGSKGIPRKNVKDLLGKPLVAWAVESALDSGVFDRVVISTDDQEIASIGSAVGAEVPFMRPPELAGDGAAMLDVVVHALSSLDEDGYPVDAVAVLQPTAPLRHAGHIRKAVELLDASTDSVCSVVELPPEISPHYVMRIQEDGTLTHFLEEGSRFIRRQDVPLAYRRDGTIYLVHSNVVLEQRSLYGQRCRPLVLTAADSVTLDDPDDWLEAEAKLAARIKGT